MYLLAAVKTRLDAIVSGGRGTAPPFDAEDQARALPVGWFVAGANAAHPGEPGEKHAPAGDRTYDWRWRALGDVAGSTNPRDPTALKLLRVELRVAYVYGKGNEGSVRVAAGTTETAAAACAEPELRALSDADRLQLALEWPPLYQGADIAPVINSVQRDGESAWELGRDKRLVCVTPYRLHLARANVAFNPGMT